MDDYNVKQIGDFPSATDITDDDVLLAEQAGKTRKLSGKVLKDFCRAAISAFTTRAETAATAAEAAKNAAAEIEQIIGEKAGVASFNGRAGIVLPQSGDYTAAMVGAAPSGYGYGGESLYSCEAESKDESWETFCERLDAVLNTMINNSTKQITVYPPTIWGSARAFATVFKMSATNAAVVAHNYTSSYGFRLSKRNGVWSPVEWIDPVMSAGVEYRTTERYLGKPVYTEIVPLNTLPNNGAIDGIVKDANGNEYAYGAINVFECVGFGCTNSNGIGGESITLPYYNDTSATITLRSVGRKIYVNSSIDASGYYGFAKVKYIKATDS